MYQTLSAAVSARHESKKSQFLAFAYPIASKHEVAQHIRTLRSNHSDARHFCMAYIIGDPHNTTSAGFDDDGEPNGTAGRPILTVLQHKGIGDVCVVVVRYFGGIKLGAGGLARAYAAATQIAVEKMVLTPFVATCVKTVLGAYKDEAQIRYLVGEFGGSILKVVHEDKVMLLIQMTQKDWPGFEKRLGMQGQIIKADEFIKTDE